MLAVYETIDLGLVSSLRQVSTPPTSKPLLDLLSASLPVFVLDPLHDDIGKHNSILITRSVG